MAELTPLDLTHQAMQSAPEDVEARLKYFERLADSELFLLLTEEAKDDRVSPELFEVADAQFVLVFDREERLSEFVGKPAPYVARTRDRLCWRGRDQYGLNPEVAPSTSSAPMSRHGCPTPLRLPATNRPDQHRTSALSPRDPYQRQKAGHGNGIGACRLSGGVEYDTGVRGHVLGVVDAYQMRKGLQP